MTFSATDHQFMARALQLAEQGLYSTDPNPRVGCVIVNDGKIVGEGFHIRAGEGHAEVHALQQAGDLAKGATAYVTLEPCSHQGRTPPCAQGLINAEVASVICAMQDPNPQVSGNGLNMLREASITVASGLLETQARELNPGFIKRMETGLPFVRIKLAMSVDGRTAMANGESQWITGPAARQNVQKFRARSSAILTGIESILADDSSLMVRADELPLLEPLKSQALEQQPLRVVLDTQGRIPSHAKILNQPGRTLVVTSERTQLTLDSADVWQMSTQEGQLDLRELLERLGQEECNEVLVETGATLAGAFIEQQLVDETIVYMAPCLMGSDARPLLSLPLQAMAEKHTLKFKDVRMVGDDLRLTLTH